MEARLAPALGGALIGLSAGLLMLPIGRIAGIGGIVGRILCTNAERFGQDVAGDLRHRHVRRDGLHDRIVAARGYAGMLHFLAPARLSGGLVSFSLGLIDSGGSILATPLLPALHRLPYRRRGQGWRLPAKRSARRWRWRSTWASALR
ncbi:hypothetical protein [Mesorhizobium sp.]|uniref:hypothetical protein n=1 Tax=Mesorhizobium sp. TaxID=1871066 RepID=UPI00345945AD